MQYFNIQVASQLSGVASATIRAWEKRYHAVTPERGENKHRLYSEKDIEKLALLSKLTELGQSIGKIAHLDLEELKNIYSTLLHRPYDEKQLVTPHHDKIDYGKILANLHLALATYKLDILSHELEKAKNVLGPREFCLELLVPLFHEIGNKVANRELSIFQEHTLSALVTFHLGQMIGHHYQRPFQRKELFLITTPEGERHEIGILGASLLCVHHGVKFIYLGASLPASSLVEAVEALRPTAVILGATKGHELDEQRTLNDYIQSFQESLRSSGPDIWVGGNLKSVARMELEKKKIRFFPTLASLDGHLQSQSHL